MAFQLNDLDLLDPYTLEEQLTGVDLLYFYQIISDLKYKQMMILNLVHILLKLLKE